VSLLPAVLRRCPHVAVLATSRAALQLHGERLLGVLPLSTPSADRTSLEHVAGAPAVQLFVERARTHDPRFEIDAGNAGIVAEICRRLDGMPLAIELAAPRAVLPRPAALLARLDRRLPLLTGEAAATCPHASRRCGTPRPGAMACSGAESRYCSGAWPSSLAAACSMLLRPLAATG
jgi:predicted ATPase